MGKRKSKLVPQRRVLFATITFSPSVDNTCFFDNGYSLSAFFDSRIGDGYKVHIRSIKVTVRTESPSLHWIQPLLIETTASMTDAIDITADQSIVSMMDTQITGSFGHCLLGDIRASKDVPGNNRAGGETLTEVASEGTFFTVNLPQDKLRQIEAEIEEPEPTKETSLAFLGWMRSQVADLNLHYWIQFDYDVTLNNLGMMR